MASLRIIWVSLGPLLGCRHIEMSRAGSARCNSLADVVVRSAIKHVPGSVLRDAHERIVRCGLEIVPVSSDTEDKFEDAMEVAASSPLPEIARVEIRSATHLSLREHISCVHFLRGQSRGFWVKTLWQQTASTQRCGEAVNRGRADFI